MKLTPFAALVIGMGFTIICTMVILVHIHANFPTCK
jgi:hypothetical protein